MSFLSSRSRTRGRRLQPLHREFFSRLNPGEARFRLRSWPGDGCRVGPFRDTGYRRRGLRHGGHGTVSMYTAGHGVIRTSRPCSYLRITRL
jgi:hypothetical protein